MNRGARDANAESAQCGAANRERQQIALLKEIRDLLKQLLNQSSVG